MSAIAVYFVFSYRLWRKPSHHIEVEDKVFSLFHIYISNLSLRLLRPRAILRL